MPKKPWQSCMKFYTQWTSNMLKRKKISEDHYSKIARRYESGESQASIAKSYGVSHATIGNILRDAGVETRVGGGKFYKAALEKSNAAIKKMLDEEWTLTAIAFIEGISVQALHDRISLRGYQASTRRYGDDIQGIYDAIRVAWQFGLTVEEIKARFQVSSDQVARATADSIPRGKGYWQAKKGRARAAQFKVLYEQGMSMHDVAKVVGCDEASVNRMIRKYCPESIRSPAQTKKKKAISLKKASNDELMKGGKYSHIPSLLAISKSKRPSKK